MIVMHKKSLLKRFLGERTFGLSEQNSKIGVYRGIKNAKALFNF